MQDTSSKYPFVGDNYRIHGEQAGYIYYPWTDQYYADPKAVQSYQQQAGYAPEQPETPGLLSSLAPIAGAGLAMGVGQGLAKDPSGFIGGIGDSVSGLFGLGGGETAAAETANVAASAPVAEATTTTGSGLLGLGESAAPEAIATSVQTGAPATAAELSAAASQAPATGFSGAGVLANAGSMGALPVAGILGGTALGVKGALDTIKGDDTKGALDWGSRATIGIATGGLSEGYRALDGLFGSKDTWKTEGNRLNSLADDGTYIPQNLLDEMPTGGRSREELTRQDLAMDFVGRDDAGAWVNNKFAQSRDVADLQPEDIVNYAAFAENDPEWFNKPLEDRLVIAQQALQKGAVSEGHGSINIDWKKLQEEEEQAQEEQPE